MRFSVKWFLILMAVFAGAIAFIILLPTVFKREPLQLTHAQLNNKTPYWNWETNQIIFTETREGENVFVGIRFDGTEQTDFHVQFREGHFPKMSSGGKSLIFQANQQGNNDIWRYDIVTGSMAQLTTDKAADLMPAWSPDGRQIAFVSRRTGNADIWLLDMSTNKLRQLTQDIGDDQWPAWSPDGDEIAFASNRSGNWDVWTIPATGGKAEQLTSQEGLDDAPAWSPNGRYIAYRAIVRDNSNIWIVDRVTKQQYQLTQGDFFDWYPTWSPDGRYIAFQSNRNGNENIWYIETPSFSIMYRLAVKVDKLMRFARWMIGGRILPKLKSVLA